MWHDQIITGVLDNKALYVYKHKVDKAVGNRFTKVNRLTSESLFLYFEMICM